ncbi:hypothetical protein HZ326_6019 [Fusarium oxysporum f. sp. albedinis]|nr:hypothetical protein HZ326_6019 [Fusarium oxysporum f. sp. albedinis]
MYCITMGDKPRLPVRVYLYLECLIYERHGSITCKLVRTLVDRQLYPFATRYSYPPPMTSFSGGLYLNTVSFSQGAGLGALPERCVTTGSKGKQLE